MVGEEGVTDTNDINILHEGAGKTWALRRKEIFGERPHRPKKFASVYFISAGDRIKIGFSQRPTERLKELQTSHHMTLELLATIPGSYQTEARLHKKFAHLKQKGEWFVSRPDLMAFIDRINGKREPGTRTVEASSVWTGSGTMLTASCVGGYTEIRLQKITGRRIPAGTAISAASTSTTCPGRRRPTT